MPEREFLIARVCHYPRERRPYVATIGADPLPGRGETPDDALRNLRRNLIRYVRTAGLSAGLARARVSERAVRTFLPEVVMDGPTPETGSFKRAVPWDFKRVVLGLADGELLDRARVCDWERFETQFLYDFPPAWELDTAAAFNQWLACHDDHVAKPVTVSIRRRCNLLGEHGPDRIRLRRGLTPLQSWQVFLHELAHYRHSHHGRAFVLELARVYALWRKWFAGTWDTTRATPGRRPSRGSTSHAGSAALARTPTKAPH